MSIDTKDFIGLTSNVLDELDREAQVLADREATIATELLMRCLNHHQGGHPASIEFDGTRECMDERNTRLLGKCVLVRLSCREAQILHVDCCGHVFDRAIIEVLFH